MNGMRRSMIVLLALLVLVLAACGGAAQEPAAEEAAAQPTEMMAEMEPTAAMDERAAEPSALGTAWKEEMRSPIHLFRRPPTH